MGACKCKRTCCLRLFNYYVLLFLSSLFMIMKRIKPSLDWGNLCYWSVVLGFVVNSLMLHSHQDFNFYFTSFLLYIINEVVYECRPIIVFVTSISSMLWELKLQVCRGEPYKYWCYTTLYMRCYPPSLSSLWWHSKYRHLLNCWSHVKHVVDLLSCVLCLLSVWSSSKSCAIHSCIMWVNQCVTLVCLCQPA